MRSYVRQGIQKLAVAGLIGLGAAAPLCGQLPDNPWSNELTAIGPDAPAPEQDTPASPSDRNPRPTVPLEPAAGDDDLADCCLDECDDCDCVGNWFDNTLVWFGGDAYKSIGDAEVFGFALGPFSHSNSFGLTGGFNSGFGLGDSRVRAQLGASYGAYDLKGHMLPPDNSALQQQAYVTFGLYKRSDVQDDDRISWGVVYDLFFAHQWGWAGNEVSLNQIRYRAGYATNEWNEFGISGAFQTQDDDGVIISFPIQPELNRVRAKNQLNGYWDHNWDFGGMTTAYLGVFDGADVSSWQFGLLNLAPLSESASVYANFTYVAPGSSTGTFGAAEEQWNVSVGLVYYFGGKAVADSVSGQAGLPLMPVANNGNFLITN